MQMYLVTSIDRSLCMFGIFLQNVGNRKSNNIIRIENVENQSNCKQFVGQISDVNFIFVWHFYFYPKDIFRRFITLTVDIEYQSPIKTDIQKMVLATKDHFMCVVILSESTIEREREKTINHR